MEQQLIDSAKYTLSLISLDSRFADVNATHNSGFKMDLPHPLKNVMRIRMASIELPLVEYLFSEQYGNLSIAVGVGSAGFVWMQSIQPGNYTAVELINAVQVNLKLIHSGFTCTLNGINGTCTIKNSSVPFELYLYSYTSSIASRKSYWGLGYYLGFRVGRIAATFNSADGSYAVTGTSLVNIQQNQYYFIQLYYPDEVVNITHRLSENGFLTAFAKVILKDGAYTIAFDDNANLLRKEFTFLAPVTVSQITVKLLNQYGESVNMMNVEWSLTLEVTEIVNSKTYTTLSKTYTR